MLKQKILEAEIGLVDRCRLKTYLTPLEPVPNFKLIDTANIETTDEYKNVEEHAFVYFFSPVSVTDAMDAAGRCQLFFNNQALKASLGSERRKNEIIKIADVRFEIGNLVCLDKLFVAWRGPPYAVDFVADCFDGTMKFYFRRDATFSFKWQNKHAVIDL
ncbi:putative RNA-directed RNA polymerase [Rosa chinensis]|uniref:Putative RNA-directed RNA polymerase n=1 Tax=Rosa chinensis TaxID=74649 RepID=A0A2P6PCS7_ROSCH|nr:putative RNA-directed RNA polymerase [Rosa chinensis]